MLVNIERWIDRLRKAAGSKGPADSELDAGLTAAVQVADTDTYEYDYLGRVRRMIGAINCPAVAAQLSMAGVFNPAGSQLLLVVDWLDIGVSIATTVELRFLVNVLAGAGITAQNAQSTDLRWALGLPVTTLVASPITFSSGANAAVPGLAIGNGARYQIAVQNSAIRTQYVLPPGTGLAVVCNNSNTFMGGALSWKERVFDPAELV